MSYETENVNVAFSSILQAAEEYNGFLLGIPDGDVISSILAAVTASIEDINSKEEQRKIRSFFSDISDRTVGGNSLSDIDYIVRNEFEKLATSQEIEKNISIFHKTSATTNFEIDDSGTPVEGDDYNDYLASEIKHIVKYESPGIYASRTISPPPGAPAAEGSDGEEVERNVVVPESSGERTVLAPESLNQFDGHEFSKESPSLGACVIKNHKMGFNSRSANHLPVFLSAISPIEMSRCSPFLDVKILSEQPGNNKMNIYNFIRQEGSAGESINSFLDPKPVGEGIVDESTINSSYFTFMDAFTSPQTMVNANINKSYGLESLFDDFNFEENRMSYEFAPTNVTDPFQPFMTLISFDANIAGVGHGLLATKKASMRIKLHDKSRIKDISPLLSPSEFAKTKFIVEFGWSHPDSSPTSNNTIGKYLNALRDISVYQLVNADYSFGEDNSVNITLNLVASGFNQLKSISAAAGNLVSLNSIIDDIEEQINFLIEKSVLSVRKDKEDIQKRQKEIRGKLLLTRSDLNRKGTLVSFEKVSEWRREIIEIRQSFIRSAMTATLNFTLSTANIAIQRAASEAIKKVFVFIYGIENVSEGDQVTLDQIFNTAFSPNTTDSEKEDIITLLDSINNINGGDIIYAKLNSLSTGIDPFRGQVSSIYYDYMRQILDKDGSLENVPLIGTLNNPTGKYTQNNTSHVSLGKIITSFIGYPLSTCGLYDEVQLFFYPVNTQCAGARKHTTASLPIKIKDLEKEIEKRVLASEESFRDMSTQSFFAMLERIISNREASAYGLFEDGYSEETREDIIDTPSEIEEFLNKEREEKLQIISKDLVFNSKREAVESQAGEEISNFIDSGEGSLDAEDQQAFIEDRVLQAYEAFLREKVSGSIDRRLRAINEAEKDALNLKYYDEDRFTPINLSIFYEVMPVLKETAEVRYAEEEPFNIVDFYKKSFSDFRTADNKGLDFSKQILRVHIYDENSTMNPELALFGSEFKNTGGTVSDLPGINSYAYIKNLLMNYHPTIIHGASTGVVNSIQVSSNTSSQLSNILISESYGNTLDSSDSQRGEDDFDEVVLLPTTVNLDVMGMPMLARGQQIFIDFGTNTSLDNLYVIKTVQHTIEAGSFKSSVVLVPSNQMIVSSYRSRIKSMFSSLEIE